MKFILSIMLCIAFSLNSKVEASDYDVRNARWGMSTNAVISSENKIPLISTRNLIVYDYSIDGRKMLSSYFMLSGVLAKISTVVGNDYENPDKYVLDYNWLVSNLKNNYGEPVAKQELWNDETYKNDSSNLGRAVKLGHVILATSFTNDRTIVLCSLEGSGGKVVVRVEYFDRKRYEEILEAERKDVFNIIRLIREEERDNRF